MQYLELIVIPGNAIGSLIAFARRTFSDPTIAGVLGVTIGFFLAEGSRYLRERARIRKLKKMIIDELWSVRHQVAQKRGMGHEILVALSQKKILAGLSVSVLNIGYKQHISELYEHFGAIELSRITLLIVPSIKTKAC